MIMGLQLAVPGTYGALGNPVVDYDAVDKALAPLAVSGELISYSRAKRLSATGAVNANYVDRLKNPVTVQGTTKTYNPSGINSKPSVSLDGLTGLPPYKLASLQMPASFTFFAVIKPGTLKSGDYLFSCSNVNTSFYIATSSDGRISVDDDGAGTGDSSTLVAPAGTLVSNTPALLWVSHDAPSKTTRIGVGTALAGWSRVHAVAHAPAVGSNPQPLSYVNNTGAFHFAGSWATHGLLNVAHGAGGVSDVQWAAAVAAMKAFWAV